jgi:hypothetical protein
VDVDVDDICVALINVVDVYNKYSNVIMTIATA